MNNKGFALYFVIILIALVLFVGFGLYYFLTQRSSVIQNVDINPTLHQTKSGDVLKPENILCSTGVIVPVEKAYSSNSKEIIESLSKIRETLNIDLAAQIFAGDTTEKDWEFVLNSAEKYNFKLIIAFEDGANSPPKWNGTSFDLGIAGEFLKKYKDHPALYTVLVVDEPYHSRHNGEYTPERLRVLYSQLKNVAPNLPVFLQFSRQLSKFNDNGKLGQIFTDNMCDICGVSALEFRNYGEGRIFDTQTLIDNNTISRSLISQRDSEALIYVTAQTFGSIKQNGGYYMPTPEELSQMLDLLFSPKLQSSGEIDILAFQSWQSAFVEDKYQNNLSKDEFSLHRQIVHDICN